MALEKIKGDRREKLERLKAAGLNPYPEKTARSRQLAAAALEKFDDLAKSEEEIILAGRLRLLRSHGGSTFANLEDVSGQVQVYFKKDVLGERDYDLLAGNLDIGDFIEAAGSFFLTQKGEKTLLVKKLRILAKALNQLPDKWHGLNDVEERFRRRYLDLLMNKDVKKRFQQRSEIIKNLRVFLENRGFSEVETPILQSLPGGALAEPFETHLNALSLDLYLRVSPELYLKRLLVGGLEKIYELGRCFRNEGMDKSHNPDFTMLEFYWAYADCHQLMELTEELFEFLIPEQEIEYQGAKIDFSPPFKRIALPDLILENYLVDVRKANAGELADILKKNGVKTEKGAPHYKLVDELFKLTRPKIIQPTFVTGQLAEASPLAKKSETEKGTAEMFQLVVGGLELVKAYSELNDSQEQAARMKEQENNRSDRERQRFDQDYIDALEYGMPPAAGWGLGVDRLVMLLTGAPSLREVILFPAMREK
ncbi:MAG: lysine--tRNA ligase [Candidatus Portnoybacteria bacterium]|nr:lysine--tRNA ligase [Candidatus Portnoybacteria bacterium]